MATSAGSDRDLVPLGPPIKKTIDLIEFTLLITTDLIIKFDQHSPNDRWDVLIYILRQISDIQFQLLML
jgi:hypothetical protein